VGLVAAEIERHGIVTACVTMMPEITRAVGVARSLEVPFGLGRPFAAPGDPAAQARVMTALLALCTRPDVPVFETLSA
jgi:hypothetical protein